MKKLIITGLILTATSCISKSKIYYSTNRNKCIHNLETMMDWLQEDFAAGNIPRYMADNYMLVLQNTRCSLYKKNKLKHAECTK